MQIKILRQLCKQHSHVPRFQASKFHFNLY